jgi:drug/metabolite transporter (DMT)-like permease
MPLAALLLILVSAFLQAGLNFLIKGSDRKIALATGASLLRVIVFFPVIVWGRGLLGAGDLNITPWSWVGIVACGVVGTVFHLLVATAYDREDLSIVYPVTRSFGPIFILIFALILLGERVSLLGLVGIWITIFGSYVVHLPSFKPADLYLPFKAFKSKPFLFSMGGGACTAIYSLINKRNLEVIDPLTLYYLIIICMSLFLTLFLLARGRLNEIREEINHNVRSLLLIGFMGFISAAMFLFALRMSKVSYLGSARNISIVFGVILGSFLLQEGYGRIRFVASLLILAGIFLLSVG